MRSTDKTPSSDAEREATMRSYRIPYLKCSLAIILTLLIWATSSIAGEITLAWDPNCNDNPDLIGYNIYYKANSSVATDPDGADLVYIPLTDPGFDPDQPSYQVTGLSENVRYFFVVTAIYNNDESTMSNEASAVAAQTGSNYSAPTSVASSADNSASGSSSGGCFIDSIQ